MHVIHEEHKILRWPIPAGRRIIPGHLISPGSVQRMLHHRHQFDMRISHIFHILCHHRSQFPVIIKIPSVLRLLPGTKMHFINEHGLSGCVRLFSVFQPFIIFPGEMIQIRDYRSSVGTQFRRVRIRIRLKHYQSGSCFNFKFVELSHSQIRNEQFKDTGIPQTSHLVSASIPEIKVAHHADPHGIRRPNWKINAIGSFYIHGMSSHFLINLIEDTCVKFFCLFFCKLWGESVRISDLLYGSIVIRYYVCIFRNRLSWKQYGKEAFFICLFHWVFTAIVFQLNGHFFCCRNKCLYQYSVFHHMRPQSIVGIVLFWIHNRFNRGPIH